MPRVFLTVFNTYDSTYSDETVVRYDLLNFGVNFFQKPVSSDEFLHRIRMMPDDLRIIRVRCSKII